MRNFLVILSLTAFLCLGTYSVYAEPERNIVSPPTQLLPKDSAPGAMPNPPEIRYPSGCNTHEHIVNLLRVKYKEIPLIIGVSKKKYLFELFGTSFQDGNFSLVLTNTDGVACLVDSGTQLNFLMRMISNDPEEQTYTP